MTRKWLVGTMAALCCVGTTLADLDTSAWPTAAAGRGTRKAALGTAAGPAVKQAWITTSTTLTLDPTGTGGMSLSADGYLFFRDNNTATPVFTEIRASDGAIIFQLTDPNLIKGGFTRSGTIVTPTKVYVSTGKISNGTITAATVTEFDRTAPAALVATQRMTLVSDAAKDGFRSIQMGSVLYSGQQRIYGASRAPAYVAAMSPADPNSIWQTANLLGPTGQNSNGLCQLGPLWVDATTGNQMMAYAVANGHKPMVYIIRDDGAAPTVVASIDTSAYAGNSTNDEGALTTDGTGIIYNADTAGACLFKLALNGTLVWSVPQADAPVGSATSAPAIIDNLIYLGCDGGKLLCVQDNGATYTVKWIKSTGTSLNLTAMAVEKTAAGNRYIYATGEGTPGKLVILEDTGSTAVLRGIKTLAVATGFGGSAPAIDAAGNVYCTTGDPSAAVGGHVIKLAPGTGTPPVANAGADQTGLTCRAAVTVDGSLSTDDDGTIVEYIWANAATGGVLSDGTNPVTTVFPPCGATTALSLVVVDNDGFVSDPDTTNVTVGPLVLDCAAWIDLGRNTHANGSNFNTSNGAHFATDGTDLYFLEGTNGTNLDKFDQTATFVYTPRAACPDGVQDGGDFQYGDGVYYASPGNGFDTTAGTGLANRLWAYNAGTNTWAARAACVIGGFSYAKADLAFDPVDHRLYAAIVNLQTGGDATATTRLGIYNTLTDTWLGFTSVMPHTWGGGCEVEYLDGKVYAYGGGGRGNQADGSDSLLDVYDIATDTWSLTSTLAASGITTTGFHVGAFDVWGTSLSADAAHHKLYLGPCEGNKNLFIYDAPSGLWSLGPVGIYDGGWGGSQEYVAARHAIYQIDGRNASGGAQQQGTAVLSTVCGHCGDANCDGTVNNGDIDAFIEAITNSAQYAIDHPGCPLSNCDTNVDGSTNNGDIDSFISVITGGPGCGH